MVSEHFGTSLLRLATVGGSEETMLLNAYAKGAISVAMTPRQRLWCLNELHIETEANAEAMDDRTLAVAVLQQRASAARLAA